MKASASAPGHSRLTRLPPLVVLVLAVSVGWTAAGRWAAPTGLRGVATVISLIIALPGLLLIARAGREFRRHHTTIWPHGQPTHLLQSGPFRRSRNPVYLGLLLLSGLPFTWTGEPAALLAPLLFYLYINHLTIPAEEVTLAATFPGEFAAYRQQVRRWW